MAGLIQSIAFPVPTPTSINKQNLEWLYIQVSSIGCSIYQPVIHKIPVLYFPYPNSDKVIIFSHQNGTDLGQIQEYLKIIRNKSKCSVIGYEFLGYGLSKTDTTQTNLKQTNLIDVSDKYSGNCYTYPCEFGCYQSLDAVVQWLTLYKSIPRNKMILMGQSIGTGPTVEIASNVHNNSSQFLGIILVTPFLSACKVITENPLAYIVDFFCNEEKIGKILSHILIIHGTEDEVVPPSHSTRLYKLLDKNRLQGCRLKWIKGARHNDISLRQEFIDEISGFCTHLQLNKIIYTQKLIKNN